MPKKNGIAKTYSFSKETVEMLDALCEEQCRSQTNCIEKLIADAYRKEIGKYGKTKKGNRQEVV